MLHMPGKWEFVFEVRAAGKTDRMAQGFQLAEFSEEEIAKILQHGPWPPPPRSATRATASRASPRRSRSASKLFFEPRLSGTGSVLCASCHVPFRAFQDSRARAFGLQEVERNTPSLLDVSLYRWYGWDGANDSLWSQSIRPLLDEREMRSTPPKVAQVMRQLFAKDYEAAFGRGLPANDEEVLADVGKALAAFQETLVTRAHGLRRFPGCARETTRSRTIPLPRSAA